MLSKTSTIGLLLTGLLVACPGNLVFAQSIETVGSRALGMGGAFVAVASDSSATWWNPAGLAAGPFLDISVGGGFIQQDQSLPAWQDRALWADLATPPFGVSLYRFRITDIQPLAPIEQSPDER